MMNKDFIDIRYNLIIIASNLQSGKHSFSS